MTLVRRLRGRTAAGTGAGPSAPRPIVPLLSTLCALGALGFTVAAVWVGLRDSPASTRVLDDVRGRLPAGPPSAAAGGPCLDTAAATQVWHAVDDAMVRLVAHPDTLRVSDVAAGTAAQVLQDYVHTQLLAHHLTEVEVDRLEGIEVLEKGCGGKPLTVRVLETLVRDDYLRPNGRIDHADPQVGTEQRYIESYVRSGSSWRVTLIAPAPVPAGAI